MLHRVLPTLAFSILLVAGCGSDGSQESTAPDVDDAVADDASAEESPADDVSEQEDGAADQTGDELFENVEELCAFVQEHLGAIGTAAQLGEIEPEVSPVVGRDCAAQNEDAATYAAISFGNDFSGRGIPAIVEGYLGEGWSQEPAPTVTDDAVLVLDSGEFGTEQHHVLFTFGGQIFDVYVENPGEAGFGPTDPELALDTAELFVDLFEAL